MCNYRENLQLEMGDHFKGQHNKLEQERDRQWLNSWQGSDWREECIHTEANTISQLVLVNQQVVE